MGRARGWKVLILVLLGIGAGAASAEASLYWANSDTDQIGRANDPSGLAVDTNLFQTGSFDATGIASDGTHIYWLPPLGHTIGRANIDGSGVDPNYIDLAPSNLDDPYGLDVDDEYLYFTARQGGSLGVVARVKLDGTGVHTMFAIDELGISLPFGDVAVNDQYIFWNAGPFSIGRAHIDGSNANFNFHHTPGVPHCGVAVNNQHVFWRTIQGAGTISRANLDGSSYVASLTTNGTGGGGVGACGIAASNDHVFYSVDVNGGEIRRARISPGLAGEPLFSGAGTPDELALDSTHTPATVMVDRADDVAPSPLPRCTVADVNDCSLRQAVDVARAGDTVTIPSSVPGNPSYSPTFHLSLGQLEIDRSITISGTGAGSTEIDVPENSTDRVLEIGFHNANATVRLEHLRVLGGRPAGASSDGGGIRNAAKLTMFDTQVLGNRIGSPPSNSGAAGGRGGGIFSSGELTIENSAIQQNDAAAGGSSQLSGGGDGGAGGGIYSTGPLTVVNSAFSLNDAGDGGVSSVNGQSGDGGDGGAIYSTGPLKISNSTIAHNQAGAGSNGGDGGRGGGVAQSGSAAALAAVTVAANQSGTGTPIGVGGAVGALGGSTIAVKNSIFSANLGGGGEPQCGTAAGGIVSDGHNNIAFPADPQCAGFADLDPQLDPDGLHPNGGPTNTIALRAGSPAVNAVAIADCTDAAGVALTTDQRGAGFPRPFPAGGACDIGAYELQTTIPTPGCDNLSLQTDEGVPLAVNLPCHGGPQAYEIVNGPAHGAISGLNAGTGALTYTPTGGFSGTDTFTYRATNSGGSSAIATATIAVLPEKLTCADVAVSVPQGQPVTVKLSCTGGGTPAYKVDAGPASGTISALDAAAGTLTYTPNPDFSGQDSFTYSAGNAAGTSPAATVRLTVVAAGNFELTKLKRNKRRGTAKASLDLPGAGTIALAGDGIKKQHKVTDFPARVQLKVKAKGALAKLLKRHGVARTKLRFTFTPRNGSAVSLTKKVRLVRSGK